MFITGIPLLLFISHRKPLKLTELNKSERKNELLRQPWSPLMSYFILLCKTFRLSHNLSVHSLREGTISKQQPEKLDGPVLREAAVFPP